MSYQVVTVLALLLGPAPGVPEERLPAGSNRTCEQMEKFLREAEIVTEKKIPIGTTHPKRATLESGGLRHDAAVQTVHENQPWIETERGRELGYKDWWEFNVAAYELAKLLELNMVPPYVERKLLGAPASLSWWIDDSMMELERNQKKLQPPDLDHWNKEVHAIGVFYQLAANPSRHLSDFLIDQDWRLWMVDFTRSFAPATGIPNRKALVRCERKLLVNLRQLDRATLQERLGRYLTGKEIDALLSRRDKIVKFFADEIAKKGEAAVLFDLPRVGQPCGVGL